MDDRTRDRAGAEHVKRQKEGKGDRDKVHGKARGRVQGGGRIGQRTWAGNWAGNRAQDETGAGTQGHVYIYLYYKML
jgi:hypothetical protein